MSALEKMRNLFHREDAICPWWLAYTFDNPLRRFLHDPDAVLRQYVREGMTVADIGCGMGYFSIAMAKMVGESGQVIAVDIQRKMLDSVRKRAEKRGLAGRIRPIKAAKDDIGITDQVDFVLAFWMVHETEDIPRFLGQISSVLKKEGRVLIAEPKIHVSRRKFQETLRHAREAGFAVGAGPKIGISRSAVLMKSAAVTHPDLTPPDHNP